MLLEWINPLLEWLGIGLVPLLLLVIVALLIIDIIRR